MFNRERERKFFFDPTRWSEPPQRTVPLEQGYLAETGAWEVRLRRSGTDLRYTMKTGAGLEQGEWEVRVSPTEFEALWPRTEGRRIDKVRHRYHWKGRTVEVDRYAGPLEGLVVAGVAFPTPALAQAFVPSRAFGPELTYDERFKNRALALDPAAVPRRGPKPGTPGWAYGALPFRRGPRGWELVIVSTRRQDRWIFPKGQPEPGMAPEKVALAEAREEAGLSGKVVGHPLVLPYFRDTGVVNLLLFPMLVTGVAERYLELGQRERQIIPLEGAEAYGDVVRLGARWLRDYTGTAQP